ncbi:MAG: hypothetical protein LBS19_13735 [Clostridiales bacterium]|jgi:hypothetical protein|nr:hypothetical protein [Clostridiales bacterium]
MANFRGLRLTSAGENLFNKCLSQSLPFKIVKLAIGDGELAAGQDPYSLTALISEKYADESIDSSVIGDGVVQFEVIVNTARITEGFFLREIGVIALDPDIGEILYAYENAGEFPDYVPATRLAAYMRRVIRLLVKVADAANVQFTVANNDADLQLENIGPETSGAGVYAGRDEYGTVRFKRIAGLDGIEITESDGVITIRSALSGGFTDKHYRHTQNAPASVWVISHSLNKRPSITVIDSSGDTVEGAEIEYINDSSLILRFTHEFSGSAYLN